MLNKKNLFNFVYAIALVGAIMSCVGILSELLNVLQLRGVLVQNTVNMKEETFMEPFLFYLIAFLVSAVAVTFLLLYMLGKINKTAVNSVLAAACAIMLVLSFVFIVVIREPSSSKKDYLYLIQYFDYMVYYTFRSGVMSFVANVGILLVCNLLDGKRKKEQADDKEN